MLSFTEEETEDEIWSGHIIDDDYSHHSMEQDKAVQVKTDISPFSLDAEPWPLAAVTPNRTEE